jgi:hypothetical protein
LEIDNIVFLSFRWVRTQEETCMGELWSDGVEDYLTHIGKLVEDFKDVLREPDVIATPPSASTGALGFSSFAPAEKAFGSDSATPTLKPAEGTQPGRPTNGRGLTPHPFLGAAQINEYDDHSC